MVVDLQTKCNDCAKFVQVFFLLIVSENLKYWAIFGRVAIAFFWVEYSNMDVNVQDIPNFGHP
jgi:hypothetical protein